MFGTQEEKTQDFHELAHTSPGLEKDWKNNIFEKPCLEHRKGKHRTSTSWRPRRRDRKKIGKTTFFEKPCLEHRKRKHRTSAVGPPWGALRAFMRNLDGHRTLGLALWSSKGSLGNLGVHGVRGDLDPRGCPVTSCRATRAVVGSCNICGGSFFVF